MNVSSYIMRKAALTTQYGITPYRLISRCVYHDPVKQQKYLLQQLKNGVKKYNDTEYKINPTSQKRLILKYHVRSCRCSICLYKFGGDEDIFNMSPTHSIYDINNSTTRFCKD